MYDHRYVALALAALLATSAVAQTGSVSLSCEPPTQNDDETPLTDLAGFRFYWGPAVGNYVQSARADTCAHTVTGLAPGAYYFAAAAINSENRESEFSNVVCVAVGAFACGLLPPDAVLNPSVVPVATTVSVSLIPATDAPVNWNEWFLTVSSASSVRISANGSTRFDWVRQGADVGGEGGAPVATTPALGTDEDGVTAQAITLNGPVSGARTDFDGNVFTGAQVTVNGVTRSLVQSGMTWGVSFP